MLDSFLAHNRWFKGEIVVVQSDLDDGAKAGLRAAFPQVTFASPPLELASALEILAAKQPHLAGRIARFHSLSMFWLDVEGDVLFLDSDLVFTGDISSILEERGDLLAAPDRAMLQGNQRDPETLEEQEGCAGGNGFRSFNAGLMVLRSAIRCEATRVAIIDLLKPDHWDQLRSDHTDQAVLYKLFGNSVALLDQRFNRMILHSKSLRGVADLALDDALVLHFNGPAKPWLPERHIGAAQADGTFIKALRIWTEAHESLLTRLHFADKLPAKVQ